VNDSAVAIKKAVVDAIKAGDMTEVVALLNEVSALDAKRQAVVLNAVKSALNTATLKGKVNDVIGQLDVDGVSVTKQAGGKWNIQLVNHDGNIKADIPRAAVEKPTLSTNPAANRR
jgi:hypothetical protein